MLVNIVGVEHERTLLQHYQCALRGESEEVSVVGGPHQQYFLNRHDVTGKLIWRHVIFTNESRFLISRVDGRM